MYAKYNPINIVQEGAKARDEKDDNNPYKLDEEGCHKHHLWNEGWNKQAEHHKECEKKRREDGSCDSYDSYDSYDNEEQKKQEEEEDMSTRIFLNFTLCDNAQTQVCVNLDHVVDIQEVKTNKEPIKKPRKFVNKRDGELHVERTRTIKITLTNGTVYTVDCDYKTLRYYMDEAYSCDFYRNFFLKPLFV